MSGEFWIATKNQGQKRLAQAFRETQVVSVAFDTIWQCYTEGGQIKVGSNFLKAISC